MNRLSTKFFTAALATASLLSLGSTSLLAQAGATATATSTKAPKAPKPAAAPAPSDADIANAKSQGMVWVNLNSGKYHKSDAVQFYGKTKNGKFMSEADAQKAGYKAAQEPPAPKAKKGAAPTAAPK